MSNGRLEWDDFIQDDGEFTLLPEGDYDFTVKEFTRGTSRNGDNMAILKLEVKGADGATTMITENIVLLQNTIWKISSFLRSVGLKKHGERVRMRFKESVGLSGRCHVIQDEYIDTHGKKRTNNKIDQYYDLEEDLGEKLEKEINVRKAPWE